MQGVRTRASRSSQVCAVHEGQYTVHGLRGAGIARCLRTPGHLPRSARGMNRLPHGILTVQVH